MDKGDSLDSDGDASKVDSSFKDDEVNDIDEKINDNNVLEEKNDDKDTIEDDNRNVASETEYVSDIVKVDINEVDDDLPVSEVNILEDKEIPVIKIEGNNNEAVFSLVEAVSIDDNVVNDDSLKDSSAGDDDIESDKDIENENVNNSDDMIEIVSDDVPEVVKPIDDFDSDEVITIESVLDEGTVDDSDEVESDNNTEYEEIDDSNYEIEKHDIDVLIPENVSLSVVTPKKGKDIEPDLVEVLGDEEEDVELL